MGAKNHLKLETYSLGILPANVAVQKYCSTVKETEGHWRQGSFSPEYKQRVVKSDVIPYVCNPSSLEAQAESQSLNASLSFLVRLSLKTTNGNRPLNILLVTCCCDLTQSNSGRILFWLMVWWAMVHHGRRHGRRSLHCGACSRLLAHVALDPEADMRILCSDGSFLSFPFIHSVTWA